MYESTGQSKVLIAPVQGSVKFHYHLANGSLSIR